MTFEVKDRKEHIQGYFLRTPKVHAQLESLTRIDEHTARTFKPGSRFLYITVHRYIIVYAPTF